MSYNVHRAVRAEPPLRRGAANRRILASCNLDVLLLRLYFIFTCALFLGSRQHYKSARSKMARLKRSNYKRWATIVRGTIKVMVAVNSSRAGAARRRPRSRTAHKAEHLIAALSARPRERAISCKSNLPCTNLRYQIGYNANNWLFCEDWSSHIYMMRANHFVFMLFCCDYN